MGRRDVLLLSILTLATTLAWIAFDVYHAYIDSTIQESVEAQIVPITPRFDRATIDSLKTRKYVEPLQDGRSLISTQSAVAQPQRTATTSGGR